MGRIAWVTDSTAFLDEDLKNHPDVYQVPMTVILDEEEYIDGVDLTAEELFEQLIPEINFFSCPLGATIGVHAGENTLGISWFNQLD